MDPADERQFQGRDEQHASRRRVDPLEAAREAYRSLRRSDERFHACVENMLDPFALFSAVRGSQGQIIDLRIDYLNRAACQGKPSFSLDEHLGHLLAEVLPTFRTSGLIELYAGVILTGEPLSLESFPFDGFFGNSYLSRRSYDIRAVRLDDGLAVTWRDVTDRERQRRTLAEWKARYDAAMLATRQFLFDWDARTDDVVLSGNVRGILGAEAGKITHMDQWFERIHPEDRAAFDAQVQLVRASRCPFDLDYRMRRDDGEYIDVADKGEFLPDRHGERFRMIGFVTDITPRQRAARELAEKHRRLQSESNELLRANQAKDQFLATLSHELRTPLAPVLIGLESLERDRELPEAARTTLAMLRQNIQLQSRLIDDLLDLSRATRGKISMERREVDVHRLLAGAISTCAAAINGKKIDLDLDLAAPNPAVEGDGARLTQVLWNLLQNAVKFTPERGRIHISSRNDAGMLLVDVADTGMGIAPELLPRIFEPFEQGGVSVTRTHGGLGLGLSIARALAHLHGGELTASSGGPGQGATFTLRLPSCVPTVPPPTPGAPPEPAKALHILLVDDHEHTTRILGNLLGSMGHTIHTAMTLRDALALAGQHPLDLVISDLGLPDGSGLELMREIGRTRGVRGIALSGFGMEQDRNASLEAGFSHHLTKPVTLEQLEQAIAQVVGTRE